MESDQLVDQELRERRERTFRDRLREEELVLHRDQRIPRELAAQVGEEARAEGEETLPRFALSSDVEVERRTWFGERWIEILDHSAGAVRMGRFEDDPPMYVEHDRRLQAGAWRDVALEDGVIRGDPVFSRSTLGQEVRMDVVDGIRNKTSIGYRVWDASLEEVRVDEQTEEKVEVWRVTDWEPLEGSIVGVPADATVGAGRSDLGPQDPPAHRSGAGPQPATTARESTMEDGDARAQAGAGTGQDDGGGTATAADVRAGESRGRDRERERVQGILEIERENAELDLRELVGQALEAEWSPNRFAREVLRAQREGLEDTRTTPGGTRGGPAIDLPASDRRRYSIARAISQAGELESPGLETEVARALQDQLPEGYKRQGHFLVPTAGVDLRAGADSPVVRELFEREEERRRRQYRERAGLETGQSGKGQEAVFTEYGGFLEMLRTRALVITLGADFMPGLQGDVSFVKQTAAATAEWVDENPGSDVSDTELTLTLVTLDPKTLMGSTFYTRQLLRQNVISVDERVEQDLSEVHARAVDLAAIHGTGQNNQPEGVYAATGVNSVAAGGAIAFGTVVDMETEVAADDADIGAMAYLTTPEVRGQAKQTEMFSSSNGRPIWTGPVQAGEMNGYRAAASNQVSKTLGGGAEHGLIFGVWSQLMIGEWGVLDLIVDPYTKKKQGLIEVTSFQMVDVQLAYAEAFCKATGLTIPAS